MQVLDKRNVRPPPSAAAGEVRFTAPYLGLAEGRVTGGERGTALEPSETSGALEADEVACVERGPRHIRRRARHHAKVFHHVRLIVVVGGVGDLRP